MSRVGESREVGFVLVELLVVISIIGLLATGTMFGAQRLLSKSKLETGTQEILSDFRKAQQLAISKQVNYGIRFDAESNEYTIFNNEQGDIKTKQLSKGIRYDEDGIVFGGDQKVTFIPMGTADSGHLTLITDIGEKYKIVVSGIGRIRLEKLD